MPILKKTGRGLSEELLEQKRVNKKSGESAFQAAPEARAGFRLSPPARAGSGLEVIPLRP
jgi:hypothetical protein